MSKIIAPVAIVALTAMIVGTVTLAASTGSVTATVTAGMVAVTVTDGAVAYGTILSSATTATGDGDSIDDTQTITNTGNVNEDFEVKASNSTGQIWTLGATAGDATYSHATCTATCDTTPSWLALTTSYVDRATAKTPASTVGLDLKVTVPTANAGAGVATLPVDILATAS